jgi:putative holliday junction resolvase
VTASDEPLRFAKLLPERGSLLGIDASKTRLGFAGTDPERRLVTPLLTWDRRDLERDLARLRRLIDERAAVGLVLGLPLNMDGGSGSMAQRARSFAGQLVRALALPLLLQDERLTSFAVADAIAEGRVPRPKRGQPTDHYAAAVILEDALRALRQS